MATLRRGFSSFFGYLQLKKRQTDRGKRKKQRHVKYGAEHLGSNN